MSLILQLYSTKMIPAITNYMDLGSDTYKFKDFYLGNYAYILNAIITGTATIAIANITTGNITNLNITGSANCIFLLSSTNVPLDNDADIVLYTVPSEKRCVLQSATLVVGADAGDTVISIGVSGNEDDFIPDSTLSNLDNQYDSAILIPVPSTTPLKIKSYAENTIIKARVDTPSGGNMGGAVNTLFLFGYLY
jgi:hypothetical protein